MKEGDRVRILTGKREGTTSTVLVVLEPNEKRTERLVVVSAPQNDDVQRIVYGESELDVVDSP